MSFDIPEELKKLPAKPGVYLMHDAKDEIIYVGKAKILKNRVKQYFGNPERLSPKIQSMVSKVAYFEYIVVDSEKEALVLECNLIKDKRPKYNTMLKDDKMYPYIKITKKDDYPRVFLTRKMLRDGEKYFGPYTNVTAAKDLVEFFRKTFKIRSCKKSFKEGEIDGRTCLYYQIGQCDGVCQGKLSRAEYNQRIDLIEKFLGGDTDAVIRELKEKMLKASDELDFELAAMYRDRIEAIKAVTGEQKATDFKVLERDVIACYIENDKAVVQVFFMRNGKMLGREHYYLTNLQGDTKEEVLSDFIKQYYAGTPFVPAEILCEVEVNDLELIEEWLSEKRGRKVKFIVPKIGSKEHLLRLARENARMVWEKDKEKLMAEKEKTTLAAKELKDILGVQSVNRLESYDISHISGYLTVASMVVFENGKAKKNDYRKFRISDVNGPDDYKCMREVLLRRFTHAKKEEEKEDKSSFSILPDVLLMDGGKGQVSAALEILNELNINIPVCGMVKDDRHRTRALLYNGEELPIDSHSESFRLITRIQDETHRFAIEYHKSLRTKEQTHSVLDDIEGIGPKRRKTLMQNFSSIEEIKNASAEDISALDGFNMQVAENVISYLNKEN